MANAFSIFVVDTPNIKDGAVTGPKIGSYAITYFKVKRTPGSAAGTLDAGAAILIALGELAFVPLFYATHSHEKFYMVFQDQEDASYVAKFEIKNTDTVPDEYVVHWQTVAAS